MSVSVTVSRRMVSVLEVRTPFHPAFNKGIKGLGGKWLQEEKVWIVPAHEELALNHLIEKYYADEL